MSYISVESLDFSSCGTIFPFLYAQVTLCHVERPIRSLNQIRRSSLKSKGYVAHNDSSTDHFIKF